MASTDRLTRDRLKPFGLTRSKLAKLLAEHERLEDASRTAGAAFREARLARQALPKELARRAQDAATAGEDVDLEEAAASAEHALTIAQAKAKGTEQARTDAIAKIGAYLRTEEGAADRETVAAVLEERRARVLERLEALAGEVDDLAEAIGVAEELEPRESGSPSLSVVPPARHPLHKATAELVAAVRAAGPAGGRR